MAAEKSVLPYTPSASSRINHPARAETRGAKDEKRRAAVPHPMAQVRRRIGGVARRQSAAYTPVRVNYGTRGRTVFRSTTSSCRPVDRAQHVRLTTDPARVLILRCIIYADATIISQRDIIILLLYRRHIAITGPLHARCCACNDADIKPSSHTTVIRPQCTSPFHGIRLEYAERTTDFLVDPQ